MDQIDKCSEESRHKNIRCPISPEYSLKKISRSAKYTSKTMPFASVQTKWKTLFTIGFGEMGVESWDITNQPGRLPFDTATDHKGEIMATNFAQKSE
jgi:hypothetical protein